MSKVKIAGHASGSGTLTIQAPDTSSSRTITLPDETATLSTFDPDGAVVINESGADVDFRVESDDLTHALFVQGSDGFVGINNTAPNAQLVVEDERSGSIGTVLFKNTHASVEAGDEVLRVQFSGDNDCTGGHFINFFDSGGDIGRVNCASASTVAYATSSDYRLKENVVDITTPITKLKALKPKSFNFIKTPSITQDGFLAHELADVVPIAVSGEKDATKVIDTYDEDGEVNGTETVIDSQGVDNSFVVPLLTGALQEAVAKIEELTTRIETLEAE
jgi:hypothetical protein